MCFSVLNIGCFQFLLKIIFIIVVNDFLLVAVIISILRQRNFRFTQKLIASLIRRTVKQAYSIRYNDEFCVDHMLMQKQLLLEEQLSI